MTQSETGTTLVKLRKMIESMQKEEMRQIQSTHSDALAQIVSIANRSNFYTFRNVLFCFLLTHLVVVY